MAARTTAVTPLSFESTYEREWDELETLLRRLRGGAEARGLAMAEPVSGARIAALYRRACEHLALARERSYPAHIVDRLERMTAAAHELIYRRRELNLARLKRFAAVEFPRAVRQHRGYVALATATFLLPALAAAVVVYTRAELILSVVDAETAASFEHMYSPTAESIGRARTASTDWIMLGYYIRNNIGVAFQCFAAGLLGGAGSLFFLAYNGMFVGALAGHLTARGLGSTFYSFIATHSAFELTAIALAGAAGLRLGHALLAPGRQRRQQALVTAARETMPIVYGVTGLLLLAAVVEAFWSSSSWLPSEAKYGAAALCWATVLSYLTLQGRRAG
jgi:uncharacterized membrane protein SpoIIM required for sporulation